MFLTLTPMNVLRNLFISFFTKAERRFCFIAALWIIVSAFSAFSVKAESVTLKFHYPKVFTDYIEIGQPASVADILDDADEYFESVEFENLYYSYEAILFGSKVGNDYPVGVARFKLTPYFRSQRIKTVSVTASYFGGYSGSTQLGIHLYVNGVVSDGFVQNDKDDKYRDGTLTATIDEQCEYLEIKFASQRTMTENSSQVDAHKITITYEEGEPLCTNIDPAYGIQSLQEGENVILNGCVVEESQNGWFAHVVKTDSAGQAVVANGQSDTYQLPVIWQCEPSSQSYVDIYGTIAVKDGIKAIEIFKTSPASPEIQHSQPLILVNGDPLENRLIGAHERIEIEHPLGENVVIYYTKRSNVALDPESATTDPALYESISNKPESSKMRAISADEIDEYGTYIYTGGFCLAHPDNWATTPQSQISLTVQVHSAPSLTAGAAYVPSEAYTIDNAITTESISLTEDEPSQKSYYFDMQGRRVDNPAKGQILIKVIPQKPATLNLIK